LLTGDQSWASQVGQWKALQGCTMAVLVMYRHFHSSAGVSVPCMSSSTQDTARLWTPPPHDVEQAVQGLLSQLGTRGGGGERGEHGGGRGGGERGGRGAGRRG